MKLLLYVLCLCTSWNIFSQNESNLPLSLEEYIGYLKKYHPIVKQAKLITSFNEAKLLKARGAFDPKIEVDYAQKKFKNTNYYKRLNANFKIPTWYGIELKANYENNSGQFLNPELNTPTDGLYNLGVSIPLAKNLLINKRVATLRQAKLYIQQSALTQQLLLNEVIFEAISSYLNWLQYYQRHLVYQDYYTNAKNRLHNVIKNFKSGDKPAIDTLEANINLKNRELDLEKARIKYVKSTLELANHLWVSNNTPVELAPTITPDTSTFLKIDELLKTPANLASFNDLKNHPKLALLNLKRKNLYINKQLKINNLLPEINFQHHFLSAKANTNAFNVSNYKNSLQISIPLFLRKSRGDLKIANLKLQDLDFEISSTKVALQNKINAVKEAMHSFAKQDVILNDLVNNYRTIVSAEERKFSLGESSIFLINYREVKLIESRLKKIKNQYEYANAKNKLIKALGALNYL
ncbi:Outer membrane efflux protein precursor [Tenacibaculum maritimum]|uniref:TolC family protein n=1 Tax=Tenacibaculum maritimum TaxID=107401 RepID=UPI0012E51927|nr:TolC family protein [Tenacibaculum maritimum]CAA0243145.1 Outer membrane efflux protein precursor [Tenacibaculum maritimum]